MSKIVSKRNFAGHYTLTDGSRKVDVHQVKEGPRKGVWQWRDNEDRHAYGDYVDTKAEAVAGATSYLNDRAANEEAWR